MVNPALSKASIAARAKKLGFARVLVDAIVGLTVASVWLVQTCLDDGSRDDF